MAHEETQFNYTNSTQKEYPNNSDTRQHLHGFTLPTDASHSQLHKPQRKKRNGVATSLSWPVSSLPRPSAWSRLVPTPSAAGEPSPALPVRTRGSSARPALSRLSTVPPPVRPLAKSTTLLLSTRQRKTATRTLFCPPTTRTPNQRLS